MAKKITVNTGKVKPFKKYNKGGFAGARKPVKPSINYDINMAAQDATRVNNVLPIQNYNLLDKEINPKQPMMLPEVTVTAPNQSMAAKVRRGTDQFAREAAPWMGLALSPLAAPTVASMGASMLAHPLHTIAQGAAGYVGSKFTDKGINLLSKGRYADWGNMIENHTGVPSEIGQFTNPGMLAAGVPRSITDKVSRVLRPSNIINETKGVIRGFKDPVPSYYRTMEQASDLIPKDVVDKMSAVRKIYASAHVTDPKRKSDILRLIDKSKLSVKEVQSLVDNSFVINSKLAKMSKSELSKKAPIMRNVDIKELRLENAIEDWYNYSGDLSSLMRPNTPKDAIRQELNNVRTGLASKPANIKNNIFISPDDKFTTPDMGYLEANIKHARSKMLDAKLKKKNADVFIKEFKGDYMTPEEKALTFNLTRNTNDINYARNTVNSLAEKLKLAPPGRYVSASSLSPQSYILTLKEASKFANNPQYDIYSMGHRVLNGLDDFSNMSVNDEAIAAYINNMVKGFNVKGKKLPNVVSQSGLIHAPKIGIEKKYDKGGLITNRQFRTGGFASSRKPIKPNINYGMNMAAQDATKINNVLPVQNPQKLTNDPVFNTSHVLPEVTVTAPNKSLKAQVRKGTDKFARDAAPWMGLALSPIAAPYAGGMLGTMVAHPVTTLSTIAGAKAVDAGIKASSNRRYRKWESDVTSKDFTNPPTTYTGWADMLHKEAGITPIIGEFLNPGGYLAPIASNTILSKPANAIVNVIRRSDLRLFNKDIKGNIETLKDIAIGNIQTSKDVSKDIHEANKILWDRTAKLSDAERAVYKGTAELNVFNRKSAYRKYKMRKASEQTSKLWDEAYKNRGMKAEVERYSRMTKGMKLKDGKIHVQSGEPVATTLNATKQSITDFTTGKVHEIDISLPKGEAAMSLKPKVKDGKVTRLSEVVTEQVSGSSGHKMDKVYREITRNNIKHIETEMPGAVVIGSSRGVSDAGLSHVANDYDVMMSIGDYSKLSTEKFPYIRTMYRPDGSTTKVHTFTPKHGTPFEVEVTLVQTGKNGKATGAMAEQLFRQQHPGEYYRAARMVKGDDPLPIPYTADELMKTMNPTTKTIMDAYEINPRTAANPFAKRKHGVRPDAYINYADPEPVIEGQKAYVKMLVGEKGTLGHQFDPKHFNNVEANKELLNSINFIGDVDIVANNAGKMQAAINDFYINNTILSRGVSGGNLEIIEAALKEWMEDSATQAMGAGRNFVAHGYSRHGTHYGSMQIGLKLNTENPTKYIADIRHKVDGRILFTPEESQAVWGILDKYGYESYRPANTGELIRNMAHAPNAKAILKEVAEATGKKAVAYGRYVDNEIFVATLTDFNEAVDALEFAANKYVIFPKSASQRAEIAKGLTNETTIKFVSDFKKIKNLLDGGIDKAQERVKRFSDITTRIYQTAGKDIDKMFADNSRYMKRLKDKPELKELHRIRDIAEKEKNYWTNKRGELYELKRRMYGIHDNIHATLAGIGATGLFGSAAYGVSRMGKHYYNKAMREAYDSLGVKGDLTDNQKAIYKRYHTIKEKVDALNRENSSKKGAPMFKAPYDTQFKEYHNKPFTFEEYIANPDNINKSFTSKKDATLTANTSIQRMKKDPKALVVKTSKKYKYMKRNK